MKHAFQKSVTLLLTVAAATACKKEPNGGPVWPMPDDEVIVQYVDDSLRDAFNAALSGQTNCLQFPAPVDPPMVIGGASEVNEQVDDQTWTCQVQPMRFGPQFNEASIFGPSDVAYVGSILRGGTISSGEWTPMNYQGRAPLTVTSSLNTGSASASVVMANPGLSAYADAHNSLISNAIVGGTPSTVMLHTHEVKAREEAQRQLGFGVGANFGLWGGSIAGSFSWNSTQQRSRFLLKLVQAYYTMNLNTPAQPDDWFGPGHLPSHEQMIDQNHCPVYISSITYGRIAYVTIESSSSSQEVRQAIQASWNAYMAGGTFDFSNAQMNALEDRQISVFMIGGNASGLQDIAAGDIGGMIGSGAQFNPSSSPGAPIAMAVRRLSDNAIVNFVTVSDYNVRQCELTGTLVTAQIEGGPWREYCPVLEPGCDSDFGGNGPYVSGPITIAPSTDGKRVEASVNVLFNETRPDTDPDDTRARVLVTSVLYTAPPGKVVTTISANTTYHVQYMEGPDPSHGSETIAVSSGFIEQMIVNGDTGGNDLPCENNEESAYFKVKYKPFQVTLVDE